MKSRRANGKKPKSRIRVVRETHQKPRTRREPAAQKYQKVTLRFKDRPITLQTRHRTGTKQPIVFLPGLNCSQADFARIFNLPQFREHQILTFDFPGQGGAPVQKTFNQSMESLADLTKAVIDHYKLQKPIIVGHSMGGVVGTLLASKYPSSVGMLVNVEGMMDASTGFFPNRQSAIKWLQQKPSKAAKEYGKSLHQHYELRHLLNNFLSIPSNVKKVYIYGRDNRHYPWLKAMSGKVAVAEVPNAGHFVIADNPQYFFGKLVELIRRQKK